jgi:hypothetical protein
MTIPSSELEVFRNHRGSQLLPIWLSGAIASSDLHNLVYRADYRIIPAVSHAKLTTRH